MLLQSKVNIRAVYDFNSNGSPIANVIKNSSGLWDLKIL